MKQCLRYFEVNTKEMDTWRWDSDFRNMTMMSAMGNTQRSEPDIYPELNMQPLLSKSNPIHRSVRSPSRRHPPAQMTLRVKTSRNSGKKSVDNVDHETSEVL